MIEFNFELDYFDQVEADIELAKHWYYEQSPDTDLEERFANSVLNTLYKIQKNPFIYHPIFENIRIAHPKFFPYGIYFTVDEDKQIILILAVLHNKQDKNKVLKRM